MKTHELLHFAKSRGLQHEVTERLMSAYFTEGRHLDRIDDLVVLAEEAGLDPAEARAALESERHLADVRRAQVQAQAYGIQGVLFFMIDGQ